MRLRSVLQIFIIVAVCGGSSAPSAYRREGYVPRIYTLGDSTTAGVGASTVPGWRGIFFDGVAAGRPFFLIGTQQYPGGTPAAQKYLGGDPFDPWTDGIPGITAELLLSNYAPNMLAPGPGGQGTPDIVIWLAGRNSLDPSIGNESPATLLTTTSNALDYIWSNHDNEKPWFQIVLCEVFRSLDNVDSAIKTYNAGLPAIVASKSYSAHITLIHTYDSTCDNSSCYESTPVVSLVHFNDQGYTDAETRIWTGGGLGPGLLTVLGRVGG